MRAVVVAVLVCVLSFSKSAGSQEVALFGIAGQNRDGPDPMYGAGVAFTGFTRLKSIFGPDAGSLQRSGLKLGLRFSISDMAYARDIGAYDCPTDACVFERSFEHVRFQIYDLTLAVLPYETPQTRIELGGGVAGADQSLALAGMLGLSRRLGSKSPVWISAGWEPRRWFTPYLADGPNPRRPPHSWRVGLEYRFRDR